MRRFAHLLVALTCLAAVGVAPALADGAPPPLPPPGVTDQPTGGSTVPAGPTYEITPGVGGSTLPPPTDPKVAAEHAAQATKKAKPKAKHHPKQVTHGSVPTGPLSSSSAESGITTQDRVWEIGAGVFLVLVLTEVFRVGWRRRARPRTT